MSNVFVFRQPPPGFIDTYFGGGGKGGTSTQSVTIPPEVLARYNSVNARAEDTAKQPFQQYGGEFVAPLTPTQVAGTQATNAASSQAQPYYGAATALTLGGARDIGPLTQNQIGYYQNPYTQAVVNPTVQALQQQQGQQLAEQQAQAIKGGAFGGERAGLQRAQLQGQQNLALGQAIAPLYQQGYGQAVQTAQQQQGVVAQDLARQMQAGQQVAGLGTGAQQAALQGAQAQLAAGQVGQQTQQAQDTAQYQQFLQQRGYDFQVAQFLANIAMGTGALSGSTTTSTQPGGFFSDKRLKDDVREIGETHDGQPIYSYKYKGDDRTQIGLMAQDVEKKHPDAVGLMGGYKTVDYKKATEGAERTHKDMGGGLMPDGFDPSSMGGAVTSDMAGEGFERGGYVGGGLVGNDDWAQIIAANKQALGMYGGAQPMGGSPGAMGGLNIPTSAATPKLVTAGALPQQRPSGMSTAMQTGKDIAGTYKGGKEFLLGAPKSSSAEASAGLLGGGGELKGKSWGGELKDWWNTPSPAATGGLIVPRHAYAGGGNDEEDPSPYNVKETMSGEDPMKDVLKSGSQHAQLMTAKGPGGQGGQSGLGQLASGLGAAKSLYGLGTGAASGLADLGAGFSSAGNAAGLDAALGPGFFAENIGLGAGGASAAGSGLMGSIGSGLGSLFAEAGPFALLLKDGGRIPAYADGGSVPRQGYALQGGTDIPADYSPEADMPSPNAQEAGLVVERPRYSEEDFDRAAKEALALQMRRESGGDSQAKAKTSSAAGLYQITNPTAKGLIARNPQWGIEYQDVPHFAATLSPEQQQTLGLGLSKEHVRGLADKGFDITPQNVSANWFLGASGGPALLKAMQSDPSMPATSIASPAAINANQRDFFREDGTPRSVSEVYGRLNKTGGGSPVPPMSIGDAVARSTLSGAEGKKSLGDTLTSEGFVVPALGFLGSMLASDKRNLGQALGEGIMGGVGAYQSQRKMAAELPKIEAATELEKARTGEVQQTTKNLRSGMYVVSQNALGELQLYDKENPTAPPIKLTDQLGRPLPGREGLANEAKQMAGTSGQVQGAGAASDQYVSDPTKFVSKPVDVNKWSPTLSMPENYVPKNISKTFQVNPQTGKPAEGSAQITEQSQNRVNTMEAKASAAQDARLELTRLIQQFEAIPQGGITDFGAGNAKRNEILARVNGVLGILGADKIETPSQGFFEAAQKGTFSLGTKVANSIGTREPGYIVSQAVKSQPGTEMSKKGIDIVTASMLAQNDYDQDKAKFFRDYVSRFKTLEGADAAFEHYNPVKMYADRGLVNSIPQPDKQKLTGFVDQYGSQYPGRTQQAIQAFEREHGLGTAKLVLGR